MMDYATLLATIEHSQPGDWHRVEEGSGPTFLQSVGEVSGAGQHWLEVAEHHSLAVFRPDVSLTLAWGLQHRDDERKLPWFDKFADSSPSNPYFVDAFWNGQLVHREMGLIVDGARAILPMPSTEGETEWITSFEYALFDLVNGLGAGVNEFDSYVRRAGIEVR